MKQSWEIILGGVAALIMLTCLAYGPVWGASFIWDDDSYVLQNQILRDDQGLVKIWFHPKSTPQWYPMVFTSFWLQYRIWHLYPLVYHAVNILLHACSAILLWRILRRLSLPGAWLAAAIFAVHPVMVESVAWITERKNALSLFFYLCAFFAYAIFVGIGSQPAENAPGRGEKKKRWGMYALALFFFLCALWSKTVAATLPAAMLVIIWRQSGRLRVKDIIPLIPFFLLGVGLGLYTAHLEVEKVGARGGEWAFSPVERILIAGRVLWFYFVKLIWPHPLNFIYERWEISAAVWWQYLYPLAAMTAVIGLWLARKRIGRGPLAAALLFGGTLFPALGFFSVYPMRFSFVADHFQYMAAIPIIAAAAAGLEKLLSLLRAKKAALLRGLIIASFGAIAISIGPDYQNFRSLWRNNIVRNPESWMMRHNLGAAYVRMLNFGKTEQASRISVLDLGIAEYDAALRLRGGARDLLPETDFTREDRMVLKDRAIMHNDRGLAFWGRGEISQALKDYQAATNVYPENSLGTVNQCQLLAHLGDYGAALEVLDRALARSPDNATFYWHRGDIRGKMGDLAGAEEDFTEAIKLDDKSPRAYNSRGVVYFVKGDLGKAISDYRRAINISVASKTVDSKTLAEYYYNLGISYVKLKNPEPAIDYLTKSINYNPDFIPAYENRAAAYHDKKDYKNAIKDFDVVIKRKPQDANAYKNRSLCHLLDGNKQKAAEDKAMAIQLGADVKGMP